MYKTKYKWTPQAQLLVKQAKLTARDIEECEQYAKENLFFIAGQHVLDWWNYKHKQLPIGQRIKNVIKYLKF